MEIAFRAALLAHAAVAAILDGPDRIAWGQIPQGEQLPFVGLTRITGGHTYTQAGRVPTIRPQVQVDCWAGSYEGSLQLAEAVTAAIDTLTASPWQGVFLIDERRDDEAGAGPDADGSTEIYRTSLDLLVTWSPAI